MHHRVLRLPEHDHRQKTHPRLEEAAYLSIARFRDRVRATGASIARRALTARDGLGRHDLVRTPRHTCPGLAIAGVAGVFVAALAGVVTAAVTPNPEKVQWTMMPLFVSTMGAVSILPVLLDPTENLMLRAVPLVANADMIISGWAPSAHAGRILADAAIIVTWLLILGVLSRRTFRWERRR